jgi:hypothetical protein
VSTRTLKIEAAGDFFAGDVKPKIRLCGRWLERAGFKAGERVEIMLNGPGEITMRVMQHQTAGGLETVLARLTDAVAAAASKHQAKGKP